MSKSAWIVAALVSSLPVIFETGKASAAEYSGIPVNYDILPTQVVKPIPIEITTDQFKARLKQGGTLTLDGNTLTLAPPNPSKKAIAFMALDRLELKNGAKIVTNGNVLALFVNTLASENGKIVSFEGPQDKAAAGPSVTGIGTNGNAGDPGIGGGFVSLHIIQSLDGTLGVDLHGQNGGDGSNGTKGGQPPKAGRGADAQDGPGGWLTVGWCARGGMDGQPGNQGLPGGAAGAGARGGDGGILELINVGDAPVPSAEYNFAAKGGNPGSPGTPGPGGDGGLGGDGGSGSTYCGGGRGGPQGSGGPSGPVPPPPQQSADGSSIVKNLALEVIIRTSVIPTPAPVH